MSYSRSAATGKGKYYHMRVEAGAGDAGAAEREQRARRHDARREAIDTSPSVHDEGKTTTCYMCACRCGIKVHLKNGRIRHITGNRDHPVNRGVLGAQGPAGI